MTSIQQNKNTVFVISLIPSVYRSFSDEDLKRTDCTGNYSYVYDGPIPNVAHVHGAHADPESDGFTEAWFLPKLPTVLQDEYARGGDFFDTFGPTFYPPDMCKEGWDLGVEMNTYRNDQATSTLFYHDHRRV